MSAYQMTPAQHERAAELYRDAAYALRAIDEESLNLSQATRADLDKARSALERMDYYRLQQPTTGGAR